MELTRAEFKALLLIHAAYADLEMTDDEIIRIKKYVSEPTFDKIHDYYQKLSEGEILQTVMKYKDDFYPTQVLKQEILSIMEDIFHTDGEFTRLEQGMLKFYEKLL